MNDTDEKLLREIKARLDEDLERLDPRTRAELVERRREALARSVPRRRFAVPRPVLATAAMLVLVLGVSFWMHPPEGNAPGPLLDDIELLVSTGEVADYEELDFFLWLDEEQAHEG
ncbi:MAG: hypothetical protein AB1810_05905 [Pseudomonadota bacterium]